MRRLPWFLLALLSFLALADSVWLAAIQRNASSLAVYCHVAPGFDCLPALTSRYGRLFGLPLSSYAVVNYLLWLLLSVQPLFHPRRADRNALLLVVFSAGGSLFCAWLAYVSFFKLRSPCPFCLVLHLLTPLILLVSLLVFRRRSSPVAAIVREELGTILADRRLVAGLAVAAALALAGIPLANHVAREEQLDAEPQYREILEGRVPRMETLGELLGDRPFRGPGDARVTIVEFADFLCPVCRDGRDLLDEIARDEGVKFIFVPHPRSRECNPRAEVEKPGSCLAALVASYATPRGRLWEVHDALYDDPGLLDEGRADELARIAGAPDMAALRGDTRAVLDLQRDLGIAAMASVRHTPTLFVNGMGMEGMPQEWFLRELIERESRR